MATFINAAEHRLENLYDLWKKANEACPKGESVSNLILNGKFPVSELSSPWINLRKEKAREWQSNPKPDNLKFSHGEYINNFQSGKFKTGVEFLIAELKQKPDSNRACWSLLTMHELVNTATDRSIPSFMALQVGLSLETKTILLTSYYRAQEVHKFLYINMAEACLVIEQILSSLGYPITHFELTIHAFHAYQDEGASSLEKADIDTLTGIAISMNLADTDQGMKWAVKALQQKMDIKESRIETNGLKNMLEAMALYNQKQKGKSNVVLYSDKTVRSLQKVLEEIAAYNQKRSNSSNVEQAEAIHVRIREQLAQVINSLQK